MSLTPDETLALLALHLQGGERVEATHPVLKALKGPLEKAINDGLARGVEWKVDSVTKAGKPSKKTIKGLGLTEAGRKALAGSNDPMIEADLKKAAHADVGKKLEADQEVLNKKLEADREALGKKLEADRKALLAEVRAAIAPKKGQEAPLTAMAKSLEDLRKRIEAIEATRQGLPDKIDRAFADLMDRLGERPDAPVPSPAKAGPISAPPPDAGARKDLRPALAAAYKELTYRMEFRDGFVDMPKLFHKVRAAVPDLTIGRFHEELLRLSEARALQLQVANEPNNVVEPEYGIRANDGLYYYVNWPEARRGS